METKEIKNQDKDVNASLTQEKIEEVLNWAYENSINGLPGQKNIKDFVSDYLNKYEPEEAIDKMIKSQITKAGTTGFITNIGGLITLPMAVPANIAGIIFIQMRMIASIAYIRGYDLEDEQVKTFVFMALAGMGFEELIKTGVIKVGEKAAFIGLKKIPVTILKNINKIVGSRMLAKFTVKGLSNVGRLIPLVGGAIGMGVDSTYTRMIAKQAKINFEPISK